MQKSSWVRPLKVLAVFTLLQLCSSSSRLSFGKASVADRARRVLQTNNQFGDYVVQPEPELTENCNKQGVNPSELVLNDEDLKTSMDSITSKYMGPREILLQAISTMTQTPITSNTGQVINSLVGHLIIPLVFAFLSLFSLFFLFLYVLCTSCCRRTCCMKTPREGDPLTKGQKFIIIASAVVGIALVVCTIIWTVQIGIAISSVKYFPCALASLYSDVVSGYVDNTYNFIGINGVQNMITKTKAFISNVVNGSSGPTMSELAGTDMPGKGDSLLANLDTLVSKNSPSGTPVNTYTTTEITVNPDSIIAIDSTIKTGLKAELLGYVAFAKSLHSTASSISSMIGGSSVDFNSAFDTLNTKIDPVKTQLKNYLKTGTENLPLSAISSIMKIAMGVAIGLVLTSTISYFIIMYFTIFKNKCHCLKFLPKLFMLLKVFISIFFHIAVALLGFMCVLMSNICYFIYKGTTDKAFLVSQVSQAQINQLFLTCIFPDGSGDLSGFVGASSLTSKIDEFSNNMKTLDQMDQFNAQFGPSAAVASQVGGPLDIIYTDTKSLKRDDYSSSPIFSLKANMDSLNSIYQPVNGNYYIFNGGSCPSGWISYGGGPTSSITDKFNQKECFSLEKIPGGTSGSISGTRFSPFGTVTGGDTATANTKYQNLFYARNNLNSATEKYAKWMTEWTTFYGTPTSSATTLLGYYKLIKDNYARMADVKTQSATLITFLKKFQGNMLSALNCRIMSKEIKALEIATCVKFANSLMNATTSMYAMAVFLFFFSWCICCGLRCAPKKDPNLYSNQVGCTEPNQPANYFAKPTPGPTGSGVPENGAMAEVVPPSAYR